MVGLFPDLIAVFLAVDLQNHVTVDMSLINLPIADLVVLNFFRNTYTAILWHFLFTDIFM